MNQNTLNKEVNTVFFTIVARNYVSYARTLCKSIRKNYPDAKIFVAISDLSHDIPDINVENCDIITVEQLNLPNGRSMELRYDVMEFSTAIKPYVFQWIFDNCLASNVIYLDPDIEVISPLTEVERLLNNGSSVVLTPHLLSPIEDNLMPDELTMLRVGTYNLGFIAASSIHGGRHAMDWWAKRLEYGACVDLERGLFTDQKWADLIPSLFDGVAILRDAGYNLAYWNLMHRNVRQENDIWYANDKIISFIHFSGVNPLEPKKFSKHQNRFTVNDIGALKILYERYLNQLLENGYTELIKIPYELGKLDGESISGPIRTYIRSVLESPDNTALQKIDINKLGLEFFNELEPSIPNNDCISRWMFGIYLSRPDLRKAFNLKFSTELIDYSLWVKNSFKDSNKNDSIFLLKLDERIKRKSISRMHLKRRSIRDFGSRTFINFLTLIFKASPRSCSFVYKKILPLGAKEWMAPYLAHEKFKSNLGATSSPKNESIFSIILRGLFSRLQVLEGVSLYGYVRGDFGVAENLRSVAGALSKKNYKFDIVEVDPGALYSKTSKLFDARIVKKSNFLVELFCINADQMGIVFSNLGLTKNKSVHRIGYWFWELPNFPDEWRGALECVDEIWAPTLYIQAALSKFTNKPIVHMPVAVEFDRERSYQREEFGLPGKDFLFLFSFDLHSFSARKNPTATLKAFLDEFKDLNENVGLVIKVIYGDKHPDEYNSLLKLSKNDSRIHVINEALSRDKMYGLIDVCNCYVSLHRAEGFGLGMAEAMYLRKPVIATAYSGNLDFMTADNSCLVDYELVPVNIGEYPYADGQFWANPSIDSARRHMRKIFENVDYRNKIAENGHATIVKNHSFSSVGEAIKSRLSKIYNKETF